MEAQQLDAVGRAVLEGLRRSGQGFALLEGNDEGEEEGGADAVGGKERALPKGIRPVDLINQLLDSHSKAGRFERAWWLFKDVIEPLPSSSQPTTTKESPTTTATTTSSSSTDTQQPSRALLRPSPKTYSILLAGCARWNKGVEAMFLVKDAAKRNVPLTEDSLRCAMQACANAGDSQNVRRIMREMEAMSMPIPRLSLQRLLVAQALRGEVKANEALLQTLARQTTGGEEGGVRVAEYVCAGFHARALEAFDALVLPEGGGGRQREDYAAALTAATALKDARRVADILDEMEGRLEGGREGGGKGEVVVGPTELGLACRIFRRGEDEWEEEEEGGEEGGREGGFVSGDKQVEGEGEEKQTQQRRCLEVVGRLIKRSDILFLNSTYAHALRRAGREEEARKLSERLLVHRMEGGGSPAWKQLTSYASQMVALGVLGQWPVAHYLYEEMRCRSRSGLAGREVFLLRALMRAYQVEEQRAEVTASSSSSSSSKQKAVLHDLALRAYRDAYSKGCVNHWSAKKPEMMDVHRYSLYLARLAVETVLLDLAAKPRPRGKAAVGKGGGGGGRGGASATSLQDLWIVTGAGKHNHVPRVPTSRTTFPLKPIVSFQTAMADSFDNSQEESSSPYHMTLRNKLARALASEHGLFSAEDLGQLLERGDGRLLIRKEAIQAWIDRRRGGNQKGDRQKKKAEEPKQERVKKALVW